MSRNRLQHIFAVGAVLVLSYITCVEAMTEPPQWEGHEPGQNAAILAKALNVAIGQHPIGHAQIDGPNARYELARLSRRSFKFRRRFSGNKSLFHSALREKMDRSFMERRHKRLKSALRKTLTRNFELRQQNHSRKRQHRVNLSRLQQEKERLFREGKGLRAELNRRFDRQRRGPAIRRSR